MPTIDGVSLPFLPAGGVNELNRSSVPVQTGSSKANFKDVFETELNKLKFSAHAQSRMTSREIDLTGDEMIRLETAVAKAEEKGANESMIMLNDRAFIVSVANKTVITVVNNSADEQQVVSNIDSAVLA